MEKEYFDSVIEIVSDEIKEHLEEKNKDNSDYNRGVIAGMYYVADSIMDYLKVQNEVEGTNNYTEFIELVENLEKNL